MSKVWLKEGKPYDPTYEEIPPEYVGFVYQITDTETGEKYIGQKTIPSYQNPTHHQNPQET